MYIESTIKLDTCTRTLSLALKKNEFLQKENETLTIQLNECEFKRKQTGGNKFWKGLAKAAVVFGVGVYVGTRINRQ